MAGAGYKLFNTGDVLTAAQVNTYLQEQAVMRFANAAARTTALSGVLAEGMMSYLDDTNSVEVYNGSAWVSVGGASSPLTTKGDLYTYSTTNARLAVGNNGETLVADSSTSTGLRYTAGNALGNPVLNSAMQVWQRGTSFAIPSNVTNTYTADRWLVWRNATGSTASRQLTNDSTNLPFIQYCTRIQRDSGNTSTVLIDLLQPFETVNTLSFAGRTVTLSFYGRKGANFSAASDAVTFRIWTGTGTDQNPIVGYTGGSASVSSTATLTNTWQRFTVSGTLPTTVNEMSLEFFYTPVGTAGAADFFEITGVQIDLGSVALPFRTYAATLAGERSACMRYYQRRGGGSTASASIFGLGFSGNVTSATSTTMDTVWAVPFRTSPSFSYSGTVQINAAGINRAVTAIGNNYCSAQAGFVDFTVGGGGMTTGNGCILLATSDANAYIEMSAEL